MFTRSMHIAPRAIALLAAILSTAGPVSAQVSTVFDPVGDPYFPFVPPSANTGYPFAAPFQDFVRGRLTKTASGDFEFLMELAAPVPVAPPLSPPGRSEIWWFWVIDTDPTTVPVGYPWMENASVHNMSGAKPADFIVYVSWDGAEFAANAIDRRPLLTGGEAIITPVPFSINGTIVEAVLASELIGDVPPSFLWGAGTAIRAGPVGSLGYHFVDEVAVTVFGP